MEKDDQSAGPAERERREFFRIDDRVSLNYRLMPELPLDELVKQLENELDSQFTVVSSLAGITQQMSVVMHQIEAARPEIAAYLKSMDKKIDLLGRAFLAETTNLLDQPVRAVNLSATGVSFEAAEPAPVGRILEMKVLLMPSFIGIVGLAEVVSCEAQQGEDGSVSHALRVKYLYMSERDRDMLIQHVIQQQSSQLRKQRELREQLEE